MELSVLEQIALHRLPRPHRLPFPFRRQPQAPPARVGIGFVETHMTHGLVVPHHPEAGQRVGPPIIIVALPVERRLPAAVAHGGPAVGEPEVGPAVATIVQERPVLAVRHQPAGDPVGTNQDLVPGRFVIESKCGARISHVPDATRLFDPA